MRRIPALIARLAITALLVGFLYHDPGFREWIAVAMVVGGCFGILLILWQSTVMRLPWRTDPHWLSRANAGLQIWLFFATLSLALWRLLFESAGIMGIEFSIGFSALGSAFVASRIKRRAAALKDNRPRISPLVEPPPRVPG